MKAESSRKFRWKVERTKFIRVKAEVTDRKVEGGGMNGKNQRVDGKTHTFHTTLFSFG